MGPLGLQETIVIFVLALLIFGPKKLPELGKTIGKAMTEFRRASSELKSTWDREMTALEREQESLKQATQKVDNEVAKSYYDDGSGAYDYDSGYEYGNGYDNPAATDSSTVGATETQGAEQTAANTANGEGAGNGLSTEVAAAAAPPDNGAAPGDAEPPPPAASANGTVSEPVRS
jgi:TatA/E family protein of Tat protein translocase